MKKILGKSALEEHLLRLFRQRPWDDRGCLVMLPPCASQALIPQLLQTNAVVGVLGNPAIFEAFPTDPRLFLAPRSDCWTSHLPRASTLIVAESLGVVSWQWIMGAWRSGIESLTTLEAGGNWKKTNSLWAFVTQVSLRIARKLIQKLVFGNNTLARLWWEKLGTAVQQAEGYVPCDGKIVLVIGSLAAGGAERQVVHLANNLAGVGADVSVLVQRLVAEEDRFFLSDLAPGVGVFELPLLSEWESMGHGGVPIQNNPADFRIPVWMSMLLHPRFVDEVNRYRRFFLERRPTVVHAWLDSVNVAAGLAAILADVPKVLLGGRNLAPYRFSFSQPYFRPLYKMLLSFPNVTMLNNSHAGLVDYAQWLGADEELMRVVYNGIAGVSVRPNSEEVAAWKKACGLVEGRAVIGGVFRFAPEKDPICWVDVARRTLDLWPKDMDHPHFLMVGDGPLWKETVAYASKQTIDAHITFVKREPQIALAICAMDVLLLTSLDEGTPNVLIEAQALGCPVVTTDVGGCPETVLDGRTGWVVKAGDRDALCERLLSALLDRTWQEKARACGPEFVESRFGNRRLVEEMCGLYGIDCV